MIKKERQYRITKAQAAKSARIMHGLTSRHSKPYLVRLFELGRPVLDEGPHTYIAPTGRLCHDPLPTLHLLSPHLCPRCVERSGR